MTLEELREEIERRRDNAQLAVVQAATALEIAKAELRAHDAAVEAAASERIERFAPLGPDNLNGGRAARRNIPEVVYELLSGIPRTTEELAEEVGGVKISQVQAALLKLGDKVVTEPVKRYDHGVTMEVPGYARREEPPP